VIAVGRVDELVSAAGTYTVWQFDRPEAGRRLLAADPAVTLVDEGEHRIDASLLASLPEAVVTRMDPAAVPAWIEKFVAAGVAVLAVHRVAPSLEELFLRLTEGETVG